MRVTDDAMTPAHGSAVGRLVLYTVCCMSRRTQIYLSDEQRARLDELADRHQVTMAEVVRRAIDAYVQSDDDLDATFGAAVDSADSAQS